MIEKKKQSARLGQSVKTMRWLDDWVRFPVGAMPRPALSRPTSTDRSRAEKLRLVCGVMGDVMLCDRERDIHRSQKFYATVHSEKMTFLTIVLFCKR
jgi:hypothetical protein